MIGNRNKEEKISGAGRKQDQYYEWHSYSYLLITETWHAISNKNVKFADYRQLFMVVKTTKDCEELQKDL